MDSTQQPVSIWVLANHPDQGCFERLGDAARLAQVMGCRVGVALLQKEYCYSSSSQTEPHALTKPSAFGPFWGKGAGSEGADSYYVLQPQNRSDCFRSLIEHGADLVRVSSPNSSISTPSSTPPFSSKGQRGRTNFGAFADSNSPIPNSSRKEESWSSLRISPLAMAQNSLQLLKDQPAKIVFIGGDPAAREWGALLAAKTGWEWISPVLLTRFRSKQLQITRLDASGRKACSITSSLERPVIVSMRDGVAEVLPESIGRTGIVEEIAIDQATSTIHSKRVPVVPAQSDIRDCRKLISGGRGLGSAAGFDLLRLVAEQLDAGVSASRMAVDQGWIEYERQVGQTGKTVQPDLYIACGISGASHHLDGMSSAKHIVAINSDPAAPIMKVAHLKLAADLHGVLIRLSEKLKDRTGQSQGEGR
jgi:electron transfer flavoprotein alpha subunit